MIGDQKRVYTLAANADENINKKQKITKTLDELVSEVFDGKYEDFRDVIFQENITSLKLLKRMSGSIEKLGQALQGTPITQLLLNYVGADGIKALPAVLRDTNITQLGLSFIRADGVKTLTAVLKDMNITHLNLNFSDLDDDNTQALAVVLKDTKITSLDLGWNDIGAEAFKALIAGLKDTNIKHLKLRGNNIGTEGIQALGAVLKDTIITHLDLRENNIGAEGSRSLMQGIVGSKVTHLNLLYNNISPEDTIEMASAIPHTWLIELKIENPSPDLTAALKLNYEKIFIPPYQVALRGFEKLDDFDERVQSQSLNSKLAKIVRRLTDTHESSEHSIVRVPEEIRTLILSHLKGMDMPKAKIYMQHAKAYVAKKQLTKSKVFK
jgi:hypothetical protein